MQSEKLNHKYYTSIYQFKSKIYIVELYHRSHSYPRNDSSILYIFRDEPIWPVTNAARFHDISERSNVLSEPKALPASFQLRRVLTNQPGEGRVSDTARYGKTTPRLLALSAPLDRKRYIVSDLFRFHLFINSSFVILLKYVFL